MKNKLVVYTALFGDYDDLIDPKEKYDGCDFICFTDQKNLKSDVWKIQIVEDINFPLNMINRQYKLLAHLFLSEYEHSLYIDSNIILKKNPIILSKKYLNKKNFLVPKHPIRKCIYEESKVCISLRKSKLFATFSQIYSYSNEKYPKNYGLGENNIIFRRHNDENVIKIMEDWWNEINTKTQRDQLSLGYVLWKHNNKFNFINENARINNEYFDFINHNSENNITVLKKLKKIVLFKYFYFISSLFWKFLK